MPKAFSLILALLLLAPSLQAEVWVSASMPTGFRFASEGASLYDFDQTASGSSSGYSLLVNLPLPFVPVLGLSRFEIEAQPTNKSIDDPNHFEVDSYDFAFDFSTKAAKFLLGYGVGQARFLCSQADCTGLEFAEREINQYFLQLGVPLGAASDFHLDLRSLSGRVQIDNGTETEDLKLEGMLYSFGFRLGF